MASISELLQQGIEAAKAKKADEAVALLRRVVELDPRNEMAWLWLSDVVDTDEQRVVCLENVLAVNPRNQAAQEGLVFLKRTAGTMKPLREGVGEPRGSATAAVAGVGAKPKPDREGRKSGSGRRWFLLGSAGAVFLLLLGFQLLYALGLVGLPGRVLAPVRDVDTPTGVPTTQPRRLRFSGHGQQATRPFTLKQGLVRFEVTHDFEDATSFHLRDSTGKVVDTIVCWPGQYRCSNVGHIRQSGSYLLTANASEDWTIIIEQQREN